MFFKSAVVLMLFIAANNADGDAAKECMKTMSIVKDMMSCCEDTNVQSLNEIGEVDCETAKKLGKTIGYYKDDKPNDENIKKAMMDVLKGNPEYEETIKLVIATCSEGNYEDKLPKDECLPRKFLTCILGVSMTGCRKWKSSDECKKATKVIEQCETALLK